MRKFSWVYYDTRMGNLALVQRPHKRTVNPKMSVCTYDEDGSIQDFFLIPMAEFRKRFVYLSGLNTKGRPKRKVGMAPELGMGYESNIEQFEDPYEAFGEWI